MYMCLTCDYSISKDDLKKLMMTTVNSDDPINTLADKAGIKRACCKMIILNNEIFNALESDYSKISFLEDGFYKEFETLNFKEYDDDLLPDEILK